MGESIIANSTDKKVEFEVKREVLTIYSRLLIVFRVIFEEEQ